jgi:hypothetical protein
LKKKWLRVLRIKLPSHGIGEERQFET